MPKLREVFKKAVETEDEEVLYYIACLEVEK